MNASFAMVPFLPADFAKINESLFEPAAIHAERKRARVARLQEQRATPRDLNYPDWEYGYERHVSELRNELLPASAFLSVEVVQPDGNIRSCSRPILGRFAVRGEFRPTLLVPSPRCTEGNVNAINRLNRADTLLVNLQALRGERTTAFVRAVLRARRSTQSVLVVASSPADLLFLGEAGLANYASAFSIGEKPALQCVRVVLVGRERPQLEREFDVTLRELRDESPTHGALVQLGLRAWWAANQSLVVDPQGDWAIRKFTRRLEQLAISGAREAGDLSAFQSLLVRTLNDRKRIEERIAAVVNAVEEHLDHGNGDVSVVVKQAPSAHVLAERIAQRIGTQPRDLQDWGVYMRPDRTLTATTRPGLVVACGFSGFSSIDAILATRSPEVVLVVDPVEAALAVRSAKRRAGWLAQARISDTALSAVVNACEPLAQRGDGLSLRIAFDSLSSGVLSHFAVAATDGETKKERLLITFVNGDEMSVDATRRFDRVDPSVGRTSRVPASSLLPGDEVVITEDSDVFSDQLITSLDEGPLRHYVNQRKSWIMMVQALVDGGGLSKTQLHRQLAVKGVKVDYQTVRAWTSPTQDDDRVPERWDHFCALAKVVGITLPEPTLRTLFDSVRRLRAMHRVAGRKLVRMMRAARAGRLDPTSLSRVEAAFGIGVRDLVEATRLAVIDDVVLED
jgi:hypothetical protein